MPDIKELLISPFSLVPSTSTSTSTSNPIKKTAQRPFQMCRCDSDNEDNDFGMAPECAFICSFARSSRSNRTTKKHKQPLRAKKTRRSAAPN